MLPRKSAASGRVADMTMSSCHEKLPPMKPHVVLLAALSAISLLALAQPTAHLDPAWTLGSEGGKHEAGVADFGFARGGNAKFLRSNHKTGDKDWASLAQGFNAAQYRGKRLRFQAQVRTEGITDWSGLWMRVDCQGDRSCSFYNSEDKPLVGTQDWQLRSVTLDVPDNARMIVFGVIASGRGTVWIDELKFDVVGDDVPADILPSREEIMQRRSKPSL